MSLVVLILALQVAQASHVATLKWDDSVNPKGTTYNAYRLTGTCPAKVTLAKFSQVNTAAIDGKSFKDTTVKANKTYSYIVTAVGKKGPQSSPSKCAEVTVP
jgi:hypothetical protein